MDRANRLYGGRRDLVWGMYHPKRCWEIDSGSNTFRVEAGMIPRIYHNWKGRLYIVWPFLVRLKWLLTGGCGKNCGLQYFRHPATGAYMQLFVPAADCPVHDREKME